MRRDHCHKFLGACNKYGVVNIVKIKNLVRMDLKI